MQINTPHTQLVSFKRAFFAIAFLFFGITSSSLAQTAPSAIVSWDDNSPGTPPNDTPETGFGVWRSVGVNNTTFTLLFTTAANVTTYTDTNLAYNTTYNYKVCAVNTALTPNLQSAFSNVVTKLTPTDPIAPSAPTNLVISNITQSSLSLAWTAATDNVGVTGYRVSRNGTVLKTVTTTSTTDTGLTAATTYAYSIVALDAAGNVSGAAIALNVTTLAPTAPNAPSNVTATVVP